MEPRRISDRPPEDRGSHERLVALPEEGPELPVLHRSYCVATWGRMTVSLWDGAVRGDRVRAVIAEARKQCERHPEGGAFTLLVEPRAALPDDEARQLTSSALDEMAPYVHSAAVVLRGSGFKAATARSVISVMFLATKRRVPMRVFDGTAEAARWQCESLVGGRPVDPERYAQVLDEVIERHRRHAEASR